MGVDLLTKWRWLLRVGLDHSLNPRAREVAMWLAEHANDVDLAWPSRKTLADLMGCSIRTVHRGRLIDPHEGVKNG